LNRIAPTAFEPVGVRSRDTAMPRTDDWWGRRARSVWRSGVEGESLNPLASVAANDLSLSREVSSRKPGSLLDAESFSMSVLDYQLLERTTAMRIHLRQDTARPSQTSGAKPG
jgi:hypothetical protein